MGIAMADIVTRGIAIAIGIGIDASIATAIDVLRRFFEV